jgi:hypothetical protein
MRVASCLVLAGLTLHPVVAHGGDKDDRERVLRQFFEGRSVTVLVDMPATSKGIDVHIGSPEPIDTSETFGRISNSGVAIREGARVPITLVHVKDDLIEFQLAGGGFRSFWDGQGAVSPTYSGKSRRERELEQEIKDEKDHTRRRHLEAALQEERHLREREERRSREIADAENALRRREDEQRALGAGSRFNIRFPKRVPPQAATPDGVMEALARWVDFSSLPGGERYSRRRDRDDRPVAGDDEPEAGDGDLRRGMSWNDVRDRLGAPDEKEFFRNSDPPKLIVTYRRRGQNLELTFVNEILVEIRSTRD